MDLSEKTVDEVERILKDAIHDFRRNIYGFCDRYSELREAIDAYPHKNELERCTYARFILFYDGNKE